MRILKSQSFLRLFNSYMVDSPQPANLSYLWNFGSLLALCLGIQILTGVFLAMHYTPHVDFAFNSVEHIMRDVNAGYILRYTHANVASFFFIFVYCHIARGLFYSSYRAPRTLVWTIGVIIFILMMATAFLGYVLPYGQMSLWGWPLLAPNAYFLLINFISTMKECLGSSIFAFSLSTPTASLEPEVSSPTYWVVGWPTIDAVTICSSQVSVGAGGNKSYAITSLQNNSIPNDNTQVRVPAKKRIGPHNKQILSILFGSLLGDCQAEYRDKGCGTRFCFYQESSHTAYLIWLHSILSELGYCNSKEPEIKPRLGRKGVVRKVIRFKTWTYSNLNWVYDLWYINKIKIVPAIIGDYLTPLALAIWIMDDGCKVGNGLKLSTNSFSYSDCTLLVKVLFDNFNLKSSIQSAGKPNQYIIYIFTESMPLLREIVLPYVHPSMKYKLVKSS